MDELYKQYGQLLIRAEILQGQIQEVKRKIAEGLNAPIKPEPNEPPELPPAT